MNTKEKQQTRFFKKLKVQENFSNLRCETEKALKVEIQKLKTSFLLELSWSIFTETEELEVLESLIDILELKKERVSESKQEKLRDLEKMHKSMIVFYLMEGKYRTEILSKLMLIKLKGE